MNGGISPNTSVEGTTLPRAIGHPGRKRPFPRGRKDDNRCELDALARGEHALISVSG